METVLIVIHLLIVIAMITFVLLQRSEGGGLGIGGGGGNMPGARSSGNPLSRATAILAVCFFASSLGLSLLARYGASPTDIFDRIPAGTQQEAPAGTGGGILDQLGGDETPEPAPQTPQVPND